MCSCFISFLESLCRIGISSSLSVVGSCFLFLSNGLVGCQAARGGDHRAWGCSYSAVMHPTNLGGWVSPVSTGAGLALLLLPHTLTSLAMCAAPWCLCGPGRGLPSHSRPLCVVVGHPYSPSAQASHHGVFPAWLPLCPLLFSPNLGQPCAWGIGCSSPSGPHPLPRYKLESARISRGLGWDTSPAASPGWLTYVFPPRWRAWFPPVSGSGLCPRWRAPAAPTAKAASSQRRVGPGKVTLATLNLKGLIPSVVVF